MKILCFLILIAIAVSGCAKSPPTGNGAAPVEPQNSNAAPPASAPSASQSATPSAEPVAAGAFDSVYTNIAVGKCKTTSKDEREGWIIQVCEGVGGYKLEVYEDDIRQSINVISPDGSKSELDLPGKVASGFSKLGDKAEWRVSKRDGKDVPAAMIVRFIVDDPQEPKKKTSYLVVSKIAPSASCVTDAVMPSAAQNEEARTLADSASGKPCKRQTADGSR